MREVHVDTIKSGVAQMCIESCVVIAPGIRRAFEAARERESGVGRLVMENLLENADVAIRERMPICQDTGFVVVFVEIGQDCRVVGGALGDAINAGVAQGYEQGYLRKSVVGCPIERVNTGTNTPAVIHYEIIPGDGLTVHVKAKGFGSENMSQLKMLKPSDGLQGIEDLVMKTVIDGDANPCPPIIVGVGIGGTMEKCAIIAKKALMREVGSINPDPALAKLEADWLNKINATGIGPNGMGGKTTAMAVHIDKFPTHIAGLPVAVNIGCHVTRHGVMNF